MAITNIPSPEIKSRLSFQPLIRIWQLIAGQDTSIAAKVCQRLIDQFAEHAELLQAIEDYSILEKHQTLIEEAMISVFPPVLTVKNKLSAVAVPFSNKVLFASPLFKNNYVDERNNYVLPLDPQVEKNIADAKVNLAYKIILKKFYNIKLAVPDAFICAYPEPEQNIHNYFELEWNPQFIDVTALVDLPKLPDSLVWKCNCVQGTDWYPALKKLLPIENFVFDGILMVVIRKVTERETINRIRDVLLSSHSLEDKDVMEELQHQVRFLIHREEVELGVTSFYHLDRDVAWAKINNTSLLLKKVEEPQEIRMHCNELIGILNQSPYYFWPPGNKPDDGTGLSRHLEKEGWKSGFFAALYQGQELIGCLELFTKEEAPLSAPLIIKLEMVLELLQIALQKSCQQVHHQVNQLVKVHFTAVQSSVEWKFDDAALHYLLKQQKGQPAKMQSIRFDEVYPLFGFIDIRNSSGERNKAVQMDLMQQLSWIKNILVKAQQFLSFPLLEEMQSRVEEYIASVTNFLFAADEQIIQTFLRSEAIDMLNQFRDMIPELSKEIDAYFSWVGLNQYLLNKHKQQFEESVTAINSYITRFLEQEQAEAQQMYPHYFERFVTDGVEFNMYIGQSIAPLKKFNTIYLQNLRLWQLSFLAKTAQRLYRLSPGLPVPLETTQLLLAYNEPISVSFRTAERKFDIDGVQHVRYEVLKKRIDKALIKYTNERLTRTGSIAIVYAAEEEAKEYLQYIHHLKKQNLLTGDVERLELDELQGISGLKALRISVLLQDITGKTEKEENEISRSHHLLK